VLTVIVVGIVLMWIYIFSGAAEQESPSVLKDAGYAPQAEELCAEARVRIDTLTPARQASSPEERAATLTEANAIVATMVTDLRALGDGVETDGELLRQWFEDWDLYLEARIGQAEALAAGEDRRFAVAAIGGRPVTIRMDEFARQNDMRSCQVPLDV
jgi:hypothetical protein